MNSDPTGHTVDDVTGEATDLATELADLAETVAVEVAASLRDVNDAEIRVAGTKSSPTDLVTETDRATEVRIIELLSKARPRDAMIAEETGRCPGTSGVTWIIDPIDGTTNFVYRLAGFDISIAAALDDRVIAGVVVDPTRHEVFRASLGGGATVNGTPLHPSSPVDLARSLIGTGFSYDPHRRRAQARVVAAMIDHVRDIRRLGAAALDLCYVAAGRLDGYVESGLQPWDLAAGGLIAREAGCHVAGLATEPPDGRLVVATAPTIFTDFRALLADLDHEGLEVEDPSARVGWEFGRLVV